MYTYQISVLRRPFLSVETGHAIGFCMSNSSRAASLQDAFLCMGSTIGHLEVIK